jgi:hypothetical protein
VNRAADAAQDRARALLPPLLLAVAGLVGPKLPGLAGEIGAYLWLGVLPGLGLAGWAGASLGAAERLTLGLAIAPLVSAMLGAWLAGHGVPVAAGARAIGMAGAIAAILAGLRRLPPGEAPSRVFVRAPIIAAALIGLPALLSPWTHVRSDTWVHASLVWEILERGVPPQDPRFAGLLLNYVWIYNFFIAQLVSLGGGNLFTFMVLFNLVNFAVFLRIAWHIGARVWRQPAAGDGALALAALGFNAGAWLLFPVRLARAFIGHDRGWVPFLRELSDLRIGTVDVLFSLSAPFAYMASMLDKFMLGTALSYAWLMFALFLWAIARWVEDGAKDALLWAGLAAAGMLFIHGVVGLSVIPVMLAILALAWVLARRQAWLPSRASLAALALAIMAGVALAAPYTIAIARGWAPDKSGLRHHYFGFGYMMPWTLLTSCGITLWLAWKPARAVFRERRPAGAIFALFAAAMAAYSLVIVLPSLNHNKFPFQCFLPLAVLGGVAALPALRAFLARRGAVTGGIVLAALFLVPPALTIGSYITDPGGRTSPRLHRPPGVPELDAWILSATPRTAVFVDSGLQDLLAVEARRRLYLGSPKGPELAGFPLDQVEERRAVIADLYGAGAALDRDVASLRKLGTPVYVLYRPDAVSPPPATRPDVFEPVYDRAGYVVYRVKLP